MATSSITPTTTTSATATASAAASASSASAGVIKALGTGSGIDTQALAAGLVAAERAPRQEAIDSKISKAQATISGFSAVKYALTNVQNAFAALNDLSDFQNITASNSQSSAFTAVVDPSTTAAAAGSHSVVVNNLATAQRVTGVGGFSSASVEIPGLTTLTLGAQTIAVPSPRTPTAVVDAINGAGNGYSAQLINTGDASNPYQIVVTGAIGLAGAFALTSNATNAAGTPSLEFGHTLQAAQNASLQVDGINISSSSNQIQGAIAGVTLNLLAPTATTTTTSSNTTTSTDVSGNTTSVTTPTTVSSPVAAQLNLTQDTGSVLTNVKSLITAYNDAIDLLHELTTPGSKLETYGGTMVGNSTVSAIRGQMRDMVTGDSSTKSGTISALRDIGVELDSTGHLKSNSVKLDMALKFNFKDTVKMLSGNQQDQSQYDPASAGIAGDSYKKITAMLATSSTMNTESDNATTRISTYQDQISKLNDRMTALLARYSKQFSAMDILVGQNKSMSTGLTSTFAGMMATYTNK